jgi:hypothetical protein
MSNPTSHERWLRLVAERLHKQQRDYSIANTCEEAADAIAKLAVENMLLRQALEGLAERPNGYHDCSDYERGYGDAWAAKASMARVALKNLETASTNHHQ